LFLSYLYFNIFILQLALIVPPIGGISKIAFYFFLWERDYLTMLDEGNNPWAEIL